MNEIEQKYSNTTVFLTIAFLALFIVIPPLARILYPKEEQQPLVNQEVEEESLTNGSLVCNKDFENTGLSITSTASYEDGTITSNAIIFTNLSNITTLDGIESDAGKKEFDEYSKTLALFQTIDPTHIQTQEGATAITLDDTVISSPDDTLASYYQDPDSQQQFFTDEGYTCSIEEN